MAAWAFLFSCLTSSSSQSQSFVVFTREISCWTLEEKFHIYAHLCIISYSVSLMFCCRSKCSKVNVTQNQLQWDKSRYFLVHCSFIVLFSVFFLLFSHSQRDVGFFAATWYKDLQMNNELEEKMSELSSPIIRNFVIPAGEYGEYFFCFI